HEGMTEGADAQVDPSEPEPESDGRAVVARTVLGAVIGALLYLLIDAANLVPSNPGGGVLMLMTGIGAGAGALFALWCLMRDACSGN
ncbi:MAG: hypothetical protein KDK91_25860, partial [Gammaproteobacteria bacterium]|nr:hypothetical protein [Gammaproteobacteria bacterium]